MWEKSLQDITKKEDKGKAQKRAPETIGIGLMKVIRKEDTMEEEEVEDTVKRPFDVMYSWVSELDIPRDSYDLLYRWGMVGVLMLPRLGQKTEKYWETKVEYYAPYLLKDGMVQRMTQYDSNATDADEVRTFIKYRNRADRLIGKVSPQSQDVTVVPRLWRSRTGG